MSNPTDNINVSFSDYVKERTMKESKHLIQGIPDYAFSSDYSLRQKMRNMPGMFKFCKALTDSFVPQQRQRINAQGMRVTSRQFPRLYEIIGHCAETLGIGMPTLYIYDMGGYGINAAAYAYEDTDPLIIITTAAVERLNDEELIAILGHECGHVQNNHGIYDIAANIILSMSVNNLAAHIQLLLTQPITIALNTWSRAAEVTCDRAGCICSGGTEASLSLQAKLMSGGVLNNEQYDIDEIIKQYDDMGSYAQVEELFYADHPLCVKRMLAIKEFGRSEAFFSWHPELKKPGDRPYSKEELDIRCNKYLSTVKGEKRRN